MTNQKKRRIMRGLERSARMGRLPIQDARTGKVKMVSTKDLERDYKDILEYSEEECREYAVTRVAHNLRHAGHPFHHKTADGTIVAPDPTLEYCLSRLSEEKRKQFLDIYAPTPEQEAQAPKAVPVNRTYYGFNMYEGLL